MKKLLLSFLLIGLTTGIFAQRKAEDFYKSSNLTFGGYGEIVYNQPEGLNGKLDVQRLVILMGYKLSDKVGLLTEIEYEHVNEVYVEQFYLNYKLTDNFNIRGGLMLIPMGISNEFHEPVFFNGVNRPSVDGSIVPTTWREIGAGVSGKFDEMSLGVSSLYF